MKKIILAAAIAVCTFSAAAKSGHGGGHSSRGHSSFSHSSIGHSHSSRAATGTGAKGAHEHVSGYTTKRGTHVAGYDRSTRDNTKTNNWSTKGNVNPETGKRGTK